MTNTTETHPILSDDRLNESGTLAYRELKNLIREYFDQDTAASWGLKAQGLINQGWRPSDALRRVIREEVPRLATV